MRNGNNDMPKEKNDPPGQDRPENEEEDEDNDVEELININIARHRHALIPEVQRFYAPAPQPAPVVARAPVPQRPPPRMQHPNQFFDFPGQGHFYDLGRGPPYFIQRERHNGRDRPMPPGEQRGEQGGEQRGERRNEQRGINIAVGHRAGPHNLAVQARRVVAQELGLNLAGIGHGVPIPGGIARVVVQRDPELGEVQPEEQEGDRRGYNQGAARARGRPAGRDAAGNRLTNGQP